MNVFDEEMGPLSSDEELARLCMLIAAGLTLDEVRAWVHLMKQDSGKVN